jgi:hypothetical protein
VTFILADVSRDFDVLVVIHPVTLFGDWKEASDTPNAALVSNKGSPNESMENAGILS